MDVKALERVLKLASKYGVSHLKTANIEIDFGDSAPRRAFQSTMTKTERERRSSQMDFNIVRDNLATLHVENPLAFEQGLIENDIEDSSEIGIGGELSGGAETEETFVS